MLAPSVCIKVYEAANQTTLCTASKTSAPRVPFPGPSTAALAYALFPDARVLLTGMWKWEGNNSSGWSERCRLCSLCLRPSQVVVQCTGLTRLHIPSQYVVSSQPCTRLALCCHAQAIASADLVEGACQPRYRRSPCALFQIDDREGEGSRGYDKRLGARTIMTRRPTIIESIDMGANGR